MQTTINPRLLAALLAPIPRNGSVPAALQAITPPFAEPDPTPKRSMYLSYPYEDILPAFINTEEPENGWCWEDRAPDARLENYTEHLQEAIQQYLLKKRSSFEHAADAGKHYWAIGEKFIAASKEYDEAWRTNREAVAAWEARKQEYDFIAPRLAYADAMLRRCAGLAGPDSTITSNLFVQFTGLAEATIQQALGRSDRRPVATEPSLDQLATQWSEAQQQRKVQQAQDRRDRVSNYMVYAREAVSEAMQPVLVAATAEGIKWELSLSNDEQDAVANGRAWHNVQATLNFFTTVAPDAPVVNLLFSVPEVADWKAWKETPAEAWPSEPVLGHWGRGGEDWQNGPEALGALAALLRTKLLFRDYLPAQQEDENDLPF